MKIFCWNCHGIGNPATVRELKQLLVANDPDIVFLCETKIHSNAVSRVRSICRMEGCLAVSSDGKSGGLALMWREGVRVMVQNYSKYHIDASVSMEDGETLRFTGFYGQADPRSRQNAWDMLRREGGRRKPKTLMDEFANFLDELNLSDVKTCNGWYTWTNNRDGNGLVKERLDRFIISDAVMESLPFLITYIVRQSKSDHEAILLDTEGNKPKNKNIDQRVRFRYDHCWSKEKGARDIINGIWSNRERDSLEKMESVRVKLGPWQNHRYRNMKTRIKELEKEISRLMDGLSCDQSTSLLKDARRRLGHLYDVEERYWATRARSQWLKDGDRNTRYFHVWASGRRKKNYIERLKDTYEIWHEDKKEICDIAWKYFNELFKTSINMDDECNLQAVPECINDEINRKLNGEFTNEEILRAFNQMDPRKAPGIDGLSGSFFKDHWSSVGADVLLLCHDILQGSRSAACVNETLIVLIPKIKNPCEMVNFRPISLCRVVYKIVAKTLANRLKEVLHLCISHNQSAFVPNRMIHDNVLVAHELMHYLRSSKNGPNKGCVIKLDMSKAYDRVEWSFLEKVLLKMGFSNAWVVKIMDCVCSVRYRVKCNDTLSDVISPERGLRQGDPLSPYLFLFCMEALSRMLIESQGLNKLKGIRACKDGSRINHLFFADDALLFVRNKKSEVEEFTKILEAFERMSGQRVNLDKSMVYFSLKTNAASRAMIRGLKMKVVTHFDGYLGLPLPMGNRKSVAFKSILDRIANRTISWSKRLLSNGGKEIFIKSILQSIPTYAFSVFMVPKGILEEIQALAWGLGFRDLHRFNVALLGRQVWRLMSCRDTLCFEVLSAKYFPEGDVLHPKNIDKPSFTWKSIVKAASELYDGFGWNVGNGNKIDLWKENWGFEGLSGDSIGLPRREIQENRVCELLNEEKDGWNERRVREIYGDSVGDQVCNIPIIPDGPNDSRIWFHSPFGNYSTKSAYSWLTLRHVGLGPHRFFGKMVWKLQTLLKIRIFCWRIGHDILPIYEKISTIRRDFNSDCPRCGRDKETLIHALKDCPKARAVLVHRGLNSNCWMVTTAGVWTGSKRNNKVFRNLEEEAKVTWERATALSHDFRIFNLLKEPALPKPAVKEGWRKPNQGRLKINFDAAVKDRKTSFGIIARDHEGFILGGRAGVLNRSYSAEWAEFYALEESVNLAKENLWARVDFESDCASLVNRLRRPNVDLSTLGYCIRDLLSNLNPSFSFVFKWAPRCCNKAADQLCCLAFTNNCTETFDLDYPREIHNIVLSDAIN
ncbi:uncharacterized protein LOC105767072 [Gossypium raimondii]|uniref:uncharacterized protein LOC105767072 n=1 Tax=Gossypium raimondii TaxID=29730 RepID=UPI00227BE45F|nr:uncharacterized protein LOC105767072 [Gossypium raimondii]